MQASTNYRQVKSRTTTPIDFGRRANLASAINLLPAGCRQFIEDYQEAFFSAPGSGHNHQNWPGGYVDHIDELFGISKTLHQGLSQLRPLPFSQEDALLVLFLHDIEKPFKRLDNSISQRVSENPFGKTYLVMAKEDPHNLQSRIIKDYQLPVTQEQLQALKYIHGEGDDYRKDHRASNELGAFCHNCDYWSARGWHQEPQTSGPLPDQFT